MVREKHLFTCLKFHHTPLSLPDTGTCCQVGRDGRDGVNGEKGMRGDTGLRGPQGVQGPPGPPTGGVTYTRWGRTTCPTTQGTQLLYAGRAAGTHHAHSGGAANYLCMPDDPDHLQYESGDGVDAYIAGVEYDYLMFHLLTLIMSPVLCAMWPLAVCQ